MYVKIHVNQCNVFQNFALHGHLRLKIQTAFWDGNGFPKQKLTRVPKVKLEIPKTERSSASKTHNSEENDIFQNKTAFEN